MIRVEGPEDVLGKAGGVTVRKKVVIDLFELLDGQVAAGAVLQEALVPLLDLLFAKVGQLGQLAHRLRSQSSLVVAHCSSLLVVCCQRNEC